VPRSCGVACTGQSSPRYQPPFPRAVTFTIATIPALIASGRFDHALTTEAKSGSSWARNDKQLDRHSGEFAEPHVFAASCRDCLPVSKTGRGASPSGVRTPLLTRTCGRRRVTPSEPVHIWCVLGTPRLPATAQGFRYLLFFAPVIAVTIARMPTLIVFGNLGHALISSSMSGCVSDEDGKEPGKAAESLNTGLTSHWILSPAYTPAPPLRVWSHRYSGRIRYAAVSLQTISPTARSRLEPLPKARTGFITASR